MKKREFAPTRGDLRKIAYKFAVALKLKHKFNVDSEKAGYDWLNSFLRRNPCLSIRKSEGLSLARAQGMSRERVQSYFNLLRSVLEENELFGKPGSVFNMDETGLQLNNHPSHVIATKGSKLVSSVTSAEKGETVTLVACCNAEGNFLPPVCIMKGKNKKTEYEDGMPPGGFVYMSEKSAYINSDIFMDWLRDHFLPRKPEGKVLLVVDGHSSHCNVDTLEFAEEHDIIILSLPSHTTHFLQPLDRAVFKALKSAYANASNNWIRANPGRKITRLQFGFLLSEAWGKAATCSNAISGFRATGIYPYNPEIIPEYAFSINENPNVATLTDSELTEVPARPLQSDTPVVLVEPTPGPSSRSDVTPGKLLENLSPVPRVEAIESVRKRGMNVASVLTSPEVLAEKKSKIQQKKANQTKGTGKVSCTKGKGPIKFRKRSKKYVASSESESDDIVSLADDSDADGLSEEATCVGCGEEYTLTTKRDDWVQCLHCKNWFHECCSKYENVCDLCGKVIALKKSR